MSFVALSSYPASLPPRRYTRPRRRGLGATTAQLAGSATTTALTTTGGILTSITQAAGGVPIAGPIIAAIGAILGPIIATFNGCGQTCVQATQYANQAEVALQQAVATYMAAPVHYASAQASALAQIQAVFDALRQACSNPALGQAGVNCISDRLVRGAVTSWCHGQTGCDWYTRYYDPIANDPNVVPDPSPISAVGSTLSSLFSGGASSGNILPLLMIGGGLLLVLVVAQQL